MEAKARHSGAWTHALVAKAVETLWPLWCRAAEHALGLRVGSRSSLLLTRRGLAEPVLVEEAVESAKQQATVTNLKRRLAGDGSELQPSQRALPNESTNGFEALLLSGTWPSVGQMALLLPQTKLPKPSLKLG
eukprot:5372737-Amphidinium_carterae.1